MSHGIAHRDLKSDNLLLDLTEDSAPILVITDFGCCLADSSNGLYLPYTSDEVDKGGNSALMAPEIINQKSGMFSVLNYTKSDLWAAGAIAYEMFGCSNPFYDGKHRKKLRSGNYKEEELPELPDEVPNVMRALIRNILSRKPNKVQYNYFLRRDFIRNDSFFLAAFRCRYCSKCDAVVPLGSQFLVEDWRNKLPFKQWGTYCTLIN